MLFCDELTCLDQDFVYLQDGPLGGRVNAGILALVVLAVRRAIGEIVPLTPAERKRYGRPS